MTDRIIKILIIALVAGLIADNAMCQCDAHPLPLYEDFESIASGMPAGWTTATHQNGQWTFNGTNWDDIGLYSDSEKPIKIPLNSDRRYYYMITPKISIDDISRCIVSFYAKGSDLNYITMKIGVMTDPNNLSSFDEVQTVSFINVNNEYQFVHYNLSSYSRTGKYVAFYFEYISNYPQLLLDNIRIDFADAWTSGERVVGTGTATTDRLPVYCAVPPRDNQNKPNNKIHYSWSNMIYKASELGGAMSINKIAFYYSSSTGLLNGSHNNSFKIYLMETTKSSFNSASEILSSQGMTLVFNGDYSMVQGWNEIPLSQIFEYNGTSNLLVAVYFGNFWNRDENIYNFRYTSANSTCVYYKIGDGSVYYDTSPVSMSGNTQYRETAVSSNRPNIKFLYCNETKCRPPQNFTATLNCPNVNLSWNALTQLTNPKYTIYRDNTQIATNISEPTYTDENVTSGDHTYKIRATSTSPSCTSSFATYMVCGVSCCSPVPVSSFRVADNGVGDRQVELTWDGVSGATYKLYYGINNPPTDGYLTPNVTSPYTVPRLTNGRTYYFSLKPTGDGTTYCVDNDPSQPVNATPNCQ